MAVPEHDLIQPQQLDDLKNKLLTRYRQLTTYWKPLNLRQNYWASMYELQDILQQSKPLGVSRRFISNEPRTAVDAALSIMTRNPTTWRIPLKGAEDENQEMRRRAGRIERTLEGLVYDMDELFVQRLQRPFWETVCFQGLLRGMIWGKFHITTEALRYRRSPLIPEIFDSRMVYPYIDAHGLNHIIIEKPTTLGDLIATYPGVYADLAVTSDYDPSAPAMKLEFWSNDRDDGQGNPRKGITAVLGVVGMSVSASGISIPAVGSAVGSDGRWLVPPYFHGYTYDELPIVGVAVNGASYQYKQPLLSRLDDRLQESADPQALLALNWQGPASGVAEIGRSILSAVEEQVPQYNEVVATIFQHLSVNTYETLVFKTSNAEPPKYERGIGSNIVLAPQETVDTLGVRPISVDAYRLVELLQEERQKGVLANVLQAVSPNFASGVLAQQVANAALGSIDPFLGGMKYFGIAAGTSVLAQLQKAAPIIGAFDLHASTPKKSWFTLEFDPRTELDQGRHYRPVPVIKPSLPDDLTARMTAARMALDPRNPMMSLMTVLEEILQVDDPTAEMDRIWEDLAFRDPLIILEQMAQSLERHGEMEMAARIRDQEFVASFVEEQKMRQITGNTGGQEPGLPSPEVGPLSLNTQRDGSENNLPEGMAAAGTTGMRAGV